ncbi:MAG TPA: beta-phosphoglucomutase family hydrolase [Chitinophagaceae bacterium]|nr:beta-phosphoglucomutase family hydrolase [Chitinophagaceae bacterium]
MHNTQAFLFDMDGTMLNNMNYHLKAWKKIVAEAGSDMNSTDIFDQLYGKNTEILTRILGSERYSLEELKAMSYKKDEYYRELYGPHVQLLGGFNTFVDEAAAEKIPMAVATGTIRENVNMVLDKLQLREVFGAIVTGSDVKISKPDPETFLKAAEQLGVLPSDCIVFEDVPEGVEAARRAGMKAVVVLTSHQIDDFTSFDNIVMKIDDYRLLSVKELLYLAFRDY